MKRLQYANVPLTIDLSLTECSLWNHNEQSRQRDSCKSKFFDSQIDTEIYETRAALFQFIRTYLPFVDFNLHAYGFTLQMTHMPLLRAPSLKNSNNAPHLISFNTTSLNQSRNWS